MSWDHVDSGHSGPGFRDRKTSMGTHISLELGNCSFDTEFISQLDPRSRRKALATHMVAGALRLLRSWQ